MKIKQTDEHNEFKRQSKSEKAKKKTFVQDVSK